MKENYMNYLEIVSDLVEAHQAENTEDQAIFARFYNAYFGFLMNQAKQKYKNLNAFVYEEIVDDTFIGINKYKSFRKFVFIGDEEKDLKRVNRYLKELLKRSFYKYYRSKRKSREYESFDDMNQSLLEKFMEDKDIRKEYDKKDLIRNLKKIKEKSKTEALKRAIDFVIKSKIDGIRVKDLAKQHGISENCVSVSISRAISHIREELSRHYK